MSQKALKIVKLAVKDWKCYDEKELATKGHSIIISGKNGLGKTSLMQMVKFAFGKKGFYIPNLIKKGKDSAAGKIIFQDEKGNNFYMIVDVKRDKNGIERTTIKLETEQGIILKSKKDQDKFFGSRMLYDPVEFLRNQESAAGRRKNLTEVFAPSFGVDFSELDDKVKVITESRREIGRDQKSLKQMFDGNGVDPDSLTSEIDPVDTTTLLKAIEEAQEMTGQFEQLNEKVNSAASRKQSFINQANEAENTFHARKKEYVDGIDLQLENIESQMKRLIDRQTELLKEKKVADKPDFIPSGYESMHKSIGELREKAKQVDIETNELSEKLIDFSSGNMPDMAQLQADYESAVEKNSRLSSINALLPQAKRYRELTGKYDKLTGEIEKIREEKIFALQKASKDNLPDSLRIGLDDNDEIMLFYTENDIELPFHSNSIPSSRQIVVSVIMGMKLLENSALRVVMIDDGSLLDTETRDMLIKMIEENGFQAWIEEVSDEEDVTIQLIADVETKK